MIGARFYAQIDNLNVRGDIVENDLAKVNRKICRKFDFMMKFLGT